MSKKRWVPLPVGAHVTIDGSVSGLVVAPLPKAAGQNYVVRTTRNALSPKLAIHESRLTLRQESKTKP